MRVRRHIQLNQTRFIRPNEQLRLFLGCTGLRQE